MSLIAAVAVAAALDLSDARELPWRTYVDAQLARTDDRVLPPPPDIAVYFGKHAAEINELRAHPIVPDGTPERMLLTRIFIARAISHHDWDDLGAAWEIQRGIWQGSDFVSRIVALSGSRMIVIAARKLPPPAPKWFYEIVDLDAPRLIADMLIRDAQRYRRDESEKEPRDGVVNGVVDFFRRPFIVASASDYLEAVQLATTDMVASRRCVFDEKEFGDRVMSSMALWNAVRPEVPSLGRLWQRAASFAMERELTLKTLELKAGATPRSVSQCSDGVWDVANGALKFRKVR